MYDAIVVGAGPGGAAASYYLARAGARVLLLDKSTFPRDKTCGDGLSPRAIAVLSEMGLLERVSARAARIDSISLYSPNRQQFAAHVPHRDGIVDYGLVLPRLTLDHLILEAAIGAGVEFRAPVHVQDVAHATEAVTVRGDARGQPFAERGRCVVAATGANTRLLTRIGLLRHTPRSMLAARAYFENIEAETKTLEFHFDGVPLPGYGWLFPVSAHAANIGAGGYLSGSGRRPARTSQSVLSGFLNDIMGDRLKTARQVGPVRGYPLRVDFLDGPWHGDRLFAVGEAAGLVNPLTGEGIDYALESGRLAAGYLRGLLDQHGFSAAACAGYSRALNRRFQAQFRFLTVVNELLVNGPMLNRAVKAANREPKYKDFLVDLALGSRRISLTLAAYMLARIALN
jgi:geranylgeranyl reductase family protein